MEGMQIECWPHGFELEAGHISIRYFTAQQIHQEGCDERAMHDVWEHPQLKARERWREIGSPAGPLPALLPPGSWDEGPRMDPVPALGQHTDAILAELGYDAAAIRALHGVEAV